MAADRELRRRGLTTLWSRVSQRHITLAHQSPRLRVGRWENQTEVQTAGILARYAVAAGAGWIMYPIQAAMIYLLLLVVALVTNQDLGGPFAGPFVVVLVAAVGVPLVALVVVPAVAISELVARRGRWFWAAPAALAVEIILSALVAGVWTFASRESAAAGVVFWAVTVCLSFLPLLVTGVIAAAGSVAPAAIRGSWRRFREAGAAVKA